MNFQKGYSLGRNWEEGIPPIAICSLSTENIFSTIFCSNLNTCYEHTFPTNFFIIKRLCNLSLEKVSYHIVFKRICINYLHKYTEYFFAFFIGKTSYWIFWKLYYLSLFAVYQFEHVLCKLGRGSPHFDKNGIFWKKLPPTQKIEEYPS